MVKIPWNNDTLELSFAFNQSPLVIQPSYPAPLSKSELRNQVQQHLREMSSQISTSNQLVLILEDPSRPSITTELVSNIVFEIGTIRGTLEGFEVILATGAHYQLQEKEINKKVNREEIPVVIHNSVNQNDLHLIGTSRLGIPLIFNKKVVEADLRISVSTVNIHPLAGFSGGGKILLPGVAGLQSIHGLHSLPPGTPGQKETPMRELISEVVALLPIHFSLHLLSDPDGNIIEIFGGDLTSSHEKACEAVVNLVSLPKPKLLSEKVFLGAKPFNQNLIGTFKTLHQIPILVNPGGKAVIFNEASQGIGFHHWRNDPATIKKQQFRTKKTLQNYHVAVYSPQTSIADFYEIFPEIFNLITSLTELQHFIGTPTGPVATLPYAPITLLV